MPVEIEEMTDEALEQQLMAADQGQEFESPEPETEETRDPSSTQSDDTTAATQAGSKDKQEPVESPGKPEALKTEPEKKDSKFKDAQRRDRSWKTLETDKEEFRKEVASFQEQKADLQRQIDALRQAPKPVATAEPVRDADGYTAADYERFAKDMETEGNFPVAKAAMAKAQALRSKEPAPTAQTTAPSFSPEQWQAEVARVVQQFPELNQADAPLSRVVSNLLQSEPIFSADAKGFEKAVAVGKLQIQAHRATELEKLVETQKSEIERLNAALSLGGSGPISSNSKPKTAAELSETDFERLLQQADREGLPLKN